MSPINANNGVGNNNNTYDDDDNNTNNIINNKNVIYGGKQHKHIQWACIDVLVKGNSYIIQELHSSWCFIFIYKFNGRFP